MATPKLRFKEFNGDWERIKLSQMGTFKNGINKDKEDFGHGVPFINLMDVFGKNSICQNTFDLVNASSKEIEVYSLKQGDVLFIRSSVKPEGVAETAVVLEDLDNTVYSGFLIRYRPSRDIDLHYKKYCFSTDFFRKNVLALSTTSANTNINQESLSLLNLDLPSKPEQTKIASFLSAVDEKISQLTQKHALLSQYKQGMMQKLFSQQLRFKADDGSEFGEWEDSKLGELTTVITKGTTPSSLGEKFEESGINFIKIESLSSNGKFLLDKFAYIDENTHNKLARSKLEHDDILFSIAGALGRVAIISRDYLPANTNQALAIIRLKDKKITRYIYYFLNSDYVKKIIDAESVQLAQANFSLGQLANLDVLVPCLEEQTKISNFLSSIDQKIEVVAQQIEQAKQWKKGLLQQMFV